MKRIICIVTFMAMSLPSVLLAGDDLVVIVNKSNPIDGLTKAQLKRLVLGEQGAWPTGKKVSVVLRAPGQPEREGILRSVCGMSEDDFNQYLLHANFNGDASGAPKSLPSASGVRALVMSIPGAIGFIRAAEVNDTVKAVPVDGVAAGQPGYKLKDGK